MQKKRLDLLLVEKGVVESRSQAQRLIIAGEVLVDGKQEVRSSVVISNAAVIKLQEPSPFLSRGGIKLEAALKKFQLDHLEGKVCADIGASTGGFTDCLLKHSAKKVYAIDVGYGQLHWKLRQDPRVVVMERTNARYLQNLPEAMDLVVVDVSFISLCTLFPAVRNLIKEKEASLITLIKPQFEAGKDEAAKGRGVIQDHRVHRQVLEKVIEEAQKEGLNFCALILSPIKGPKGNIEFLALFKKEPTAVDYKQAIGNVIEEAKVKWG